MRFATVISAKKFGDAFIVDVELPNGTKTSLRAVDDADVKRQLIAMDALNTKVAESSITIGPVDIDPVVIPKKDPTPEELAKREWFAARAKFELLRYKAADDPDRVAVARFLEANEKPEYLG